MVVKLKQGNEILAGGSNGRLYAFSLNGKLRWHFEVLGQLRVQPGSADGRIFVGSSNGGLYALDAENGKLLWRYDTGEELGSVPVVVGGTVLVASHLDTLFAIDTATGKWLWQYRRNQTKEFTIRGVATPVIAGGLIVDGFADGAVVALKADNGALVWQHIPGGDDAFPDANASPQTDGQRVFVSSYQDGILALSLQKGEILWRHAFPSATGLLLDHNLYATGVGKVAAFSPFDGTKLWEKGIGKLSPTGLSALPGLLMVPTDGPIYFLDGSTGRLAGQTFNPGRGVSAAPGIYGNEIYVLSNAGWLYAMSHL